MRRDKMGLLATVVLAMVFSRVTFAQERSDDFKPIFDGKTLSGWSSPDMSYWSVEDGAVTAQSTDKHPVTANQFLVWQYGQLDDFELRLKYRIGGGPEANSGVQIRSRIAEDGHAIGYQADIDLAGQWAGVLYDEEGRGMLAGRGQKAVIAADGKIARLEIEDAAKLFASVKQGDWNEYHIVARGGQILLKINGIVTAEVIDNDAKERELAGVLALQLHSGPPMKVQFKDIQLKRLKLSDNRKKLVCVAGPPSHGYGSHEHKAGYMLLAKCLNESTPNIHTVVYTNGWPKDPTAFDNADAVSFNCDGSNGNMILPHIKEIDALAKKGVGVAFLHYALDIPKGEPGSHLLDWIGGYYETYWSVNPFWPAKFQTLPNHPITRGVRGFEINDEWYYHMRFREGMQNVTPILTAVPPDSTRTGPDGPYSGNPAVRARKGVAEVVAWAYERPGGGRGFGFTGLHDHWNWAHDDFRKLLLNAHVWITGADVPAGGVQSVTPSIEQLEANQDFPKPAGWNSDKIRRDIENWNRR